jgi:uncharacterized membrane protein YbaN (DUF454 family)
MAEIDDRGAQVEVILVEVQTRLDGLNARAESITGRAGVLIASAAIVTSLLGATAPHWAVVAALCFGIVSVGLGVFALFPSRARYTPLMTIRDGVYVRSPAAGRLWIVDDKIRFYNASLRRLNLRGWAVRAGFIALLVAVAVAGIGFMTEG